jgi:hypothetical protein
MTIDSAWPLGYRLRASGLIIASLIHGAAHCAVAIASQAAMPSVRRFSDAR